MEFGILLDDVTKSITFIDLIHTKAVRTLHDIDFSEPQWPMLGISKQGVANVSMALLVGDKIDMTPGKKEILHNVLKTARSRNRLKKH